MSGVEIGIGADGLQRATAFHPKLTLDGKFFNIGVAWITKGDERWRFSAPPNQDADCKVVVLDKFEDGICDFFESRENLRYAVLPTPVKRQ
jgi:hypothetical protein